MDSLHFHSCTKTFKISVIYMRFLELTLKNEYTFKQNKEYGDVETNYQKLNEIIDKIIR